MESNEVSNFRTLLEEDSKSPYPKYPSQALFALRDDRVVEALIVRLRNKQTLRSIKPLPYNFRTGLNFIYFEFSPNDLNSIGSDSCLVILNSKCGVVGMVDPFDFEQPNRALPPLPESEDTGPISTLPFALSRPSATEFLRFSQEELYPTEVRSRAFFASIGGGGFGDGGGLSDGTSRSPIGTQTRWLHGGWTPGPFTWEELDTKPDEIVDDYIA